MFVRINLVFYIFDFNGKLKICSSSGMKPLINSKCTVYTSVVLQNMNKNKIYKIRFSEMMKTNILFNYICLNTKNNREKF